jgi:hypothetical protein
MTATGVTLGVILFKQFRPFHGHALFPIHETGGVAARRAKLSTKPAPTGSICWANTIGITDVACLAATTAAVRRQVPKRTGGLA